MEIYVHPARRGQVWPNSYERLFALEIRVLRIIWHRSVHDGVAFAKLRPIILGVIFAFAQQVRSDWPVVFKDLTPPPKDFAKSYMYLWYDICVHRLC